MNLSVKRSFWVVDNLSLNWNVFVFFNFSLFGDVIDLLFWNVLWNVLTKVLDGIVISDGDFSRDFFYFDLLFILDNLSSFGDPFYSRFLLVLYNFLLKWNVLNSTLSFNNLLSSIDNSVDNLRGLSNSSSSIGNS